MPASIIAPGRSHVQKTNTRKPLARRLAESLKLENSTVKELPARLLTSSTAFLYRSSACKRTRTASRTMRSGHLIEFRSATVTIRAGAYRFEEEKWTIKSRSARSLLQHFGR
jgi:hypothetical protein